MKGGIFDLVYEKNAILSYYPVGRGDSVYAVLSCVLGRYDDLRGDVRVGGSTIIRSCYFYI